jgi:hypothetical protein
MGGDIVFGAAKKEITSAELGDKISNGLKGMGFDKVGVAFV